MRRLGMSLSVDPPPYATVSDVIVAACESLSSGLLSVGSQSATVL